jgi:hypothetical protein
MSHLSAIGTKRRADIRALVMIKVDFDFIFYKPRLKKSAPAPAGISSHFCPERRTSAAWMPAPHCDFISLCGDGSDRALSIRSVITHRVVASTVESATTVEEPEVRVVGHGIATRPYFCAWS